MTQLRPIKRVFIANRGEIAVRIIRACQKLDLESVVAVSDADRDSLAARMATRAICVGPSRSADSYLRPDVLITAALGTNCDAVHPGYGFLSERASFARMCDETGLKFIGPQAKAIELMGDKMTAVRLAAEAGVPRVPGSLNCVTSVEDARQIAKQIGYPLLLKASAGGGGRGMRVVREESELQLAMKTVMAEATAAFGDGSMYMEKYIERARHIEVQVLGDSFGNLVHLGERECSTQRRHQKLIEESPSPVVDGALRARLGDAAVSLAKRVGYEGAGTVEFVYNENSGEFYFLEMNTRIQVEHPVTEMVTGRDLVAEQIAVASGRPLSFTQEEVQFVGHAIECRINAEDPTRGFAPSPGRLTVWAPPDGASLRVDTHCYQGYLVPPYYDSLLAKVIAHGTDRAAAIDRLREALSRFLVEGVHTTIEFQGQVLAHDDFRHGRVTTRWVEEKFLV